MSKVPTVYEDVFFDITLSKAEINSYQIFEYTGYNAMAVFKAIRERAPTKEELFRDVDDLCMVVNTRGTNLKKIQLNIAEKGKRRINELISRYDIKGKAEARDDVTLARVVQVFASRAAMIWNKIDVVPRTFTTISGDTKRKIRPWFLPALASLFPGDLKEEMAALQMPFLLDLDKLLNQGKPVEERRLSFSRVKSFQKLNLENEIGDDDKRVEVLIKCEVLKEVTTSEGNRLVICDSDLVRQTGLHILDNITDEGASGSGELSYEDIVEGARNNISKIKLD